MFEAVIKTFDKRHMNNAVDVIITTVEWKERYPTVCKKTAIFISVVSKECFM